MRGILFKAEMIQAITEGRETQTSRVIKELKEPNVWQLIRNEAGVWLFFHPHKGYLQVKPRYQVGEVIYIEEALRKDGLLGDVCYDDENMTPVFRNGILFQLVKWQWKGYKLSPLFMPAWAARHFIKITRVEPQLFRFQALTAEELALEGGEVAVRLLKELYDGKWVWLYNFEMSNSGKEV